MSTTVAAPSITTTDVDTSQQFPPPVIRGPLIPGSSIYVVDGEWFGEHGYRICPACMEAAGSPFCGSEWMGHDDMAGYERQLAHVLGLRPTDDEICARIVARLRATR